MPQDHFCGRRESSVLDPWASSFFGSHCMPSGFFASQLQEKRPRACPRGRCRMRLLLLLLRSFPTTARRTIRISPSKRRRFSVVRKQRVILSSKSRRRGRSEEAFWWTHKPLSGSLSRMPAAIRSPTFPSWLLPYNRKSLLISVRLQNVPVRQRGKPQSIS